MSERDVIIAVRDLRNQFGRQIKIKIIQTHRANYT